MAVASSGLNMGQRAVLQHVSLTEWKLANRLPVRAGDMMLSRLVYYRWIETKGQDDILSARLIEAGLKAMRSKVK